jgi:DNA primase large subunit
MRQLYGALKSKHHLTHGGRRQFQLYLKGIGLPLDQAIVFWKTEFTKAPDCSSEKFEKDYAYGIRHAYGKEGKRVNYTPHSCGQCISADPSGRDDHGCPFKNLTIGENANGERLGELLRKMNINMKTTTDIVKKAQGMHYQIACGMTFAAVHNGKDLDAGVQSPHQYYQESRKIISPPVEAANAQSVAA